MTKCVAIIPARSGSKRLPNKNRLLFHGKPIIAYSIETAMRSGLFSHVLVSTDDGNIAEICYPLGAEPFMRPDRLADDLSGTPEVIQHAVRTVEPAMDADFICCIYPCAPLMTVEDLHAGYDAIKVGGIDFTFAMGTDPVADAGAWYWGTREAWLEGLPLIGSDTLMIPIPPNRVCDINTREDFERAEKMYVALHGEHICGNVFA